MYSGDNSAGTPQAREAKLLRIIKRLREKEVETQNKADKVATHLEKQEFWVARPLELDKILEALRSVTLKEAAPIPDATLRRRLEQLIRTWNARYNTLVKAKKEEYSKGVYTCMEDVKTILK